MIRTTENLADPQITVNLVEAGDNPGGVQLVNKYRTNRTTDVMDLVELAKQVQKADEFTRANAGSKLTVIADQIRYLQEQAYKVLQEAKRDADLHHVACNFKKCPGKVYHLYKRPSGQRYFSLLSLEDWGATCPHEYLGTYRLEYDMTWTPEKDMERRSNEIGLIDKVLNMQTSIEFPSKPNFRNITDVESKDELK
ncbi:uncharacterized protein C1orf50 homolog [Anneissia japonica]|uniref:uncharacterized protein C1orf50 homolog n=1 Tax=Anneissia japonica TaxID=1529436 RepID=UPI001425644E|nr:uncharacterized protein C1orf50 homolog [Anneissia japonica]